MKKTKHKGGCVDLIKSGKKPLVNWLDYVVRWPNFYDKLHTVHIKY